MKVCGFYMMYTTTRFVKCSAAFPQNTKINLYFYALHSSTFFVLVWRLFSIPSGREQFQRNWRLALNHILLLNDSLQFCQKMAAVLSSADIASSLSFLFFSPNSYLNLRNNPLLSANSFVLLFRKLFAKISIYA